MCSNPESPNLLFSWTRPQSAPRRKDTERGLHPFRSVSFSRTGTLNVWNLVPDDLRRSWRDNSRNKVHNKCNALESSWNPPLHSWKNCLPQNQSLVPKRWGPLSWGITHWLMQPDPCSVYPYSIIGCANSNTYRDLPVRKRNRQNAVGPGTHESYMNGTLYFSTIFQSQLRDDK